MQAIRIFVSGRGLSAPPPPPIDAIDCATNTMKSRTNRPLQTEWVSFNSILTHRLFVLADAVTWPMLGGAATAESYANPQGTVYITGACVQK
jgi:hypothetical protein